jgi:aminopeptidase YwaD
VTLGTQHFQRLAGAFALLLAAPLLASPPDPSEVGNPEITAPEVAAHVGYLASDELAGRGSGTSGNNLAARYIAERFQAAGLKPAGEAGGYYQPFSVFTGVKVGPGNQLALRSGKRVVPAAVEKEFMPLSFSGNGAAAAAVVFAGYGITAPDLQYDDYRGLNVKGKIVLVLRHTPDADDNGKFSPHATIRAKAMAARNHGAAGLLLVTGPLNDQPEDLGRFDRESASADCGIPAAIVKRAAVEPLLAPTKRTLRDYQVLIAHGGTGSAALPGATASIKVNVLREMAQTRNVIGLLEGSDPRLKNEVVVVGAHYDHLGMGGAHSLAESRDPQIHHGADDNASGTAGVIELAQYFAAHRDRLGRSVLFMGFSGEEMGLLGSAHWVKKPTIPLGRVAAMINMDMIGRMKNDSVTVIGSKSSPAWPALLEEVSKAAAPDRAVKLQHHGTALSGGLGSSDQQSFYVKKIPVLFFFTGVHPDYHRPTDTADKVNAEGEAALLRTVADTIARISRMPQRPAFAKAAEEEQQPAGPGLRVYLGTIPDYSAEVTGVQLQGVRPGGPAEKGGLKAGDVIVELDGKSIRNVEEYTVALGAARPNVPMKIVVLRGKERVTLTVTPVGRRE